MSTTARKPQFFGTDGIRDVANHGMLTPEKLLALGRALGRLALRNGGEGAKICLARDPRRSSSLLVSALSAGIVSEGAFVIDLGVLPTPGLAALVPSYGCALGVMISASHNPMQDNGIKVLSAQGAKLADADELWIEDEMARGPSSPAPSGAGVGAIELDPHALDRYLGHLTQGFPGLDLTGMHLCVDCANGATSSAAPRLFARLGARVTAIAATPDGININDGCGAVHPERMAREVVTSGAHLGLAFDGDGDRLIAASHDGAIQDGDRILYVIGNHLRARGELVGNVIVGTVMTNFGLELAQLDCGGRLERTPVGDRYVAARLREGGFSLGGEPSGHLIFGDKNRFIGDGLYSALALLSVLATAKRSFAELASGLKSVPQVLKNLRVARKPALDTLPRLSQHTREAERALSTAGRVLIRYSGTENLLRVMVEGRDAALVSKLADDLVATAKEEIGVAP